MLERPRLLPERVDPPRRPLLTADFRQLDLSIAQVDLLVEAAHLLAQMTLHARRQAAGAEGDEIRETPRLRLLDIAECGFPVLPIRSQGQTDCDQTFVHGELVFEKRHL